MLCYSYIMVSDATRWLEQLPSESFFRTSDVPGRSRGGVRVFLTREASKESPRVMRVAPNLYWKPAPPSSFSGKVHPPSHRLIGWEVAGPSAAALGWYGANLVGWSDQIALQHLEFAVPGEPKQRHPHPRVTIRSRRNLARRELTRPGSHVSRSDPRFRVVVRDRVGQGAQDHSIPFEATSRAWRCATSLEGVRDGCRQGAPQASQRRVPFTSR